MQPNIRLSLPPPRLSEDRLRPRTPCDRRLCQSQLECATLAPWPTIAIEPDPDDPQQIAYRITACTFRFRGAPGCYRPSFWLQPWR